MQISPKQVELGRRLIDWTQPNLAKAAGVSKDTIVSLENSKSLPHQSTLSKIISALTSHGVEFTDGDGVRKHQRIIRTLTGREGFRQLYEELYESAQKEGAHICLYNGVSQLVIDALGDDYVALQKARMDKIKDRYTFQVIVEEGDSLFFGAKYCDYKWLKSDLFLKETFYVFGDTVAFIDFSNPLTITVIEHEGIANSHRVLFSMAWKHEASPPDENYKN